jgi:hypothetical protein
VVAWAKVTLLKSAGDPHKSGLNYKEIIQMVGQYKPNNASENIDPCKNLCLLISLPWLKRTVM